MIYFVRSGDNGPIKIGYTDDLLAQRVALMQVGNPERLHVLATMTGDHDVERALQRRFWGGRIHGEWFRADTPGLLAFIEAEQIAGAALSHTIGGRTSDGRRICDYCFTEEVRPPRRRYCSTDCADLARVERVGK